MIESFKKKKIPFASMLFYGMFGETDINVRNKSRKLITCAALMTQEVYKEIMLAPRTLIFG